LNFCDNHRFQTIYKKKAQTKVNWYGHVSIQKVYDRLARIIATTTASWSARTRCYEGKIEFRWGHRCYRWRKALKYYHHKGG